MAIAGQLTTFKHGTNGAISTNTDFTSSIRSIRFSLNGEEVDATTFGNAFRDYEPSFINGTIDVVYKHGTTVFGQIGAILTGRDTVTFELGPTGTVATNPKVTGSMIPTTFGMDLTTGQLEEISVNYRIDGTVTFGAFA